MSRNLLSVGFQAAQGSILANLQDLTQEDSQVLLGIAGNSVNWIAGHILTVRDRVLPRLGGQTFLEPSEGTPYRAGTSPRSGSPSWIRLERIVEGLRATGDALLGRLRMMSEEAFDVEVDPKSIRVPVEKPTLGALLSFVSFHEGYHSGQLGLARRILGKPSGLGF